MSNSSYTKLNQDTTTPSKAYFIARNLIDQITLDVPLKLNEGLRWVGDGDFHNYHKEVFDSFKNETRCLDVDKYYCRQRVCFNIDHASFYVNPKVQVSYPEDCLSSKPCTIRAEEQYSRGITFSYPFDNIEELNFFVYSGIEQSFPYIKDFNSVASTPKDFIMKLPPHQTGVMMFQAISWVIRGYFIFKDRNKCDFIVPDKIEINFPIVVDGHLNDVYYWDREKC